MMSTTTRTAATQGTRASPTPPHGWGWGRWLWRFLTSMRTAVILLILLAAAAIPGSLLPQRNVATDPFAVGLFFQEHPDTARVLDKLQLFDVYGSPWFAAIYLLLLTSMTGCVVPRCLTLWRAARAAPPPGPRHLEREAAHRASESDASADDLLDAASRHLRRRGFRVVRTHTEVRAEKGYIREIGNLVFHASLLALLVGIAGGRLFGFEGRAAVVEGDNFANVLSEYDAFTPSVWTDTEGLEPLSFTLDEFDARFATSGPRIGEPRDFDARITVQSGAEAPRQTTVRPNEPLNVNGTKFFLTGHGYAPSVTVRDGDGNISFSGPVIFLPQDGNFTSDGVIKVPDAQPTQLAFTGAFLPTAVESTNGPASAFPGLGNPQLIMTAWTGDIGLGDGSPESVYDLDTSALEPVLDTEGQAMRTTLAVGQTMTLPDGTGSLTFDGVRRFANFQIAYDPGKEITLVAAILLLAGLTTSLVLRRRQIWVRVTSGAEDQLSRIDIASRALTRRELVPREIDTLHAALAAVPAHPSAGLPTDPASRKEITS